MLDLIEHLLDPVAALQRVRSLLAPNGWLVLYTPNHASLIVKTAQALHRISAGRIHGPVDELFDCLHVVFFDRPSLERAAVRSGLEPVETLMLRYNLGRSNAAHGISAAVLRIIETISPLIRGQFRLLMFARRRVGTGI